MSLIQDLATELGISSDELRNNLQGDETLSANYLLIDPITGEVTFNLLPGNQARAHRTTPFNLPANTLTIIPFDVADFGPIDVINHYYNTNEGYYLVMAEIAASSTAAGQQLIAEILLDGVLVSVGSESVSTGAGQQLAVTVADIIKTGAVQHIQARVFSSAAVALNIGPGQNYLSVVQIA